MHVFLIGKGNLLYVDNPTNDLHSIKLQEAWLNEVKLM